MGRGRINHDGKKEKKKKNSSNPRTESQPIVNQYNTTERGIYLPLEQEELNGEGGFVLSINIGLLRVGHMGKFPGQCTIA